MFIFNLHEDELLGFFDAAAPSVSAQDRAMAIWFPRRLRVSINGGTPKWMVYNGRFH